MKQIEIVGRQVWVHQTTEKPEWDDQQGLDEEIAWLSSHSSATFTLVAFSISDWNVSDGNLQKVWKIRKIMRISTVSKQQCSDEKTCKNLLAVFCDKKSRPPFLR